MDPVTGQELAHPPVHLASLDQPQVLPGYSNKSLDQPLVLKPNFHLLLTNPRVLPAMRVPWVNLSSSSVSCAQETFSVWQVFFLIFTGIDLKCKQVVKVEVGEQFFYIKLEELHSTLGRLPRSLCGYCFFLCWYLSFPHLTWLICLRNLDFLDFTFCFIYPVAHPASRSPGGTLTAPSPRSPHF